MGMFASLLGKKNEDTLKGLRLSLLLAKSIEHESDGSLEENVWSSMIGDGVEDKFSQLLRHTVTREQIKSGVTMTVSLLAALYYYYAKGMASRQQVIHLIGGEENFRILESTISGMGSECLAILRDIDELGVD